MQLKVKENVDQRQRQGMWIQVDNTGDITRKPDLKEIPEDEPKKTRSASQEVEDARKTEIMKNEKLGVPREFPINGAKQEKDQTLGLTRVDPGVPEVKEEQKEDPTRSKKSPDMRELSFHTSPTTTVCIQVRSDHRPSQVVCGPQVGEDKKDDKIVSPSARYAFPAAAYYDPRFIQGEQISLPKPSFYMRVNPEDIEPSRPFVAPGKQQMVKPQQMSPQMPSPGSAMSPKAARGQNPFRRTQPEDDNTLKQPEGAQPAAPAQPFRIIPQGPPPASVVVHKQYYQAAPLPSFASNLIAPAPVPLRLNCALQPEGAQFLQTYGTPMLRSSAPGVLPGYMPVGGEMIIPDGPTTRNAQGPPDFQGYYYNPQGRAAQPDEMMGSPYEYAAEPWVGTTFVGEDGQLYKIDDAQARSASGDQWEQGNFRASFPSSNSGMTMDDLQSKYHQQEEQLKASSEKLQQLQKQMKDMQQRAAAEEEKKKHSPAADTAKENSPAREPPSETSDEPKKSMHNKNTKRQSYHSLNRK